MTNQDRVMKKRKLARLVRAGSGCYIYDDCELLGYGKNAHDAWESAWEHLKWTSRKV